MKDYYKILQIHPEASLEVMNNAYRTLVRQYHPDLYHTQRKARMIEKMQEINEAYQVLSNHSTRAQYDQRYTGGGPSQSPPLKPSATSALAAGKRLLLWSLGTFVVGRFILSPLFSHPALRIFLLFAIIFGLIRFYSKGKPSA